MTKNRSTTALVALLFAVAAPHVQHDAVLPRPAEFRWRGAGARAVGALVVLGVAAALALAGAPVLVFGVAALHPSVQRMKRLNGSPFEVLKQAQESYKDFLPDYGDVTQQLQKVRQAFAVPEGSPISMEMLRQADYSTSTSGVLNRIFGRGVWPQLNTQARTWDMLPKSQRSRESPLGWRAKSAFASTGKGGQAEGTVPTAVTGTYVEVSPSPKEHSTQARVSGLHQDMYQIDDAYGSLAEIQGEMMVEHAKELERALNTDIDTTAGNNVESVDRIPASSANQAAIGWTAGDEDIFGIDRSANTAFDGTQDAAATARTLTTKLVDSLFRKVIKESANPTVWHTGFDTWESLADLYEARGRFEMEAQSLAGNGKVADADAMEGVGVATFVGRLHGRPIVATDQAIADSNEISRLNLFDLSNPEGMNKPRMGMDIIRPTQVYVAGERSLQAPQVISFAGDSVLLITRAQAGCRFFKVQGQLRDTTAP